MSHVFATLRARLPHWMMTIMSLSTLLLVRCDFAGVALRNARWYFRRPLPAPRHDLPRSDDALLSVLWVGHATALIQIGDRYVLTDPVFTELVGGLSRRLVQPGLTVTQLPPHLTVLVSHRHFDHLSTGSLTAIASRTADLVVPIGAAGDVPGGGVHPRELGWWQTWARDGLRVTAVPARHEGNRLLGDARRHPLAFGGYVIEYRGQTVYFAGDTAYDQALFRAVARRFPTIDLALLPIGPIRPERMMRPHHLDPEQALAAARDVGARHVVPIHFGTYLHSYDRPGDCEARFDAALGRDPELAARTSRLHMGERRVVVAANRKDPQ